jgi:FkbM family methyltransferase
MSRADQIRRLRGDVAGVLRTADPASSARWLAGLAIGLPSVVRTGQLGAADAFASRRPGRFRTPSGQVVLLPEGSFHAAREMYCRNVYLRTGLEIHAGTDVVDLGANQGLFAVRAAVMGARALAIEGQPGFKAEIEAHAARNRVSDRVRIEIAMVGPASDEVDDVGALIDDGRWEGATHSAGAAPVFRPMVDILDEHGIDHISLLKMDIEGGEFGLLAPEEDCSWLERIDQIAAEVHPGWGDVGIVVAQLKAHGFEIVLQDNDGNPATAEDPAVNYLYARRA